ncbi:hypothetical protein QTP86_012193 [Hemibagrus guttatus]|nr:hypothetical protein QTP86_012193 [Hemibagrus guttatus]
MITDFRRNTPALPPLTIMNSTVPTVESFRFLGTTISQDLKWDTHIDSIIKKAQQRLYFLRQPRKFNLPQELLTHFYSAVIESVLCTSITVWFGSATKSEIRRLHRMVRTAERIIGAPLPTLQELYTIRVRKRAQKITLDPSHPGHLLFDLLPSDDVVLLAPLSQDVQHALEWFAAKCKATGMRISTSKAEAMVLDWKKMACPFQGSPDTTIGSFNLHEEGKIGVWVLQNGGCGKAGFQLYEYSLGLPLPAYLLC